MSIGSEEGGEGEGGGVGGGGRVRGTSRFLQPFDLSGNLESLFNLPVDMS